MSIKSGNKKYLITGILVWMFFIIGLPYMAYIYFDMYQEQNAQVSIYCSWDKNICTINNKFPFKSAKTYKFLPDELKQASSYRCLSSRYSTDHGLYGLKLVFSDNSKIHLLKLQNKAYIEKCSRLINSFVSSKNQNNLDIILGCSKPIFLFLSISVVILLFWLLPFFIAVYQNIKRKFK